MISSKVTVSSTSTSLFTLLGCQNPYCDSVLLIPASGSAITFGAKGQEIVPLDTPIPLVIGNLKELFAVGSGDMYVVVGP